MEKNTAGKWVVFAFEDEGGSNPGEPVTGDAANITANIRIDGGAANAVDDTYPTELERGYYVFDLTAAETNGDLLLIAPASSSANVNVIGVPGSCWTTPANFNDLGIESDGDVSKVNTLDGHTAQTGDSFARLGAPAGAAVSADIATVDGVVDSVLVDTGTTLPATLSTMEGKIDTVDGIADSILVDTGTTLPATLSTIEGKVDTVDGVADAILVDTNELQTDWADGGRLDAILDARASQTSVDTIDGIVDSILDDTGTSGVVLAAGSVTASVIATDAIDADALAADAVGEIADGIWDEAKSGHNVAGSFGKAVRQIQEGIVSDESTVNDAAATTTSFVTALTEATDDHYNQKVITFIDGNLSGQSRVISDYNGTTKAITVDEAFTEAPANGDGFIVLAFHQHTITEIKTEVRSEMDSNSTQLAAIVEDTGTTIPAQVTALNDISVADVLTTAMSESYGTDGSEVTLAQGIYVIMQGVNEFAISGTTKTVKQLDGSTAAYTSTLDDATNPTSITRAT